VTDGEAGSIGKLLIEVSEELANMRRAHGDEVARAVAEERAAVVAYLRGLAETGDPMRATGRRRMADAIERGAHRTGEGT
jgi:hypothetical protein